MTRIHRQGEIESAAGIFPAFHPDPSSVLFDEFLAKDIAHRSSIQPAIRMLEDPESDIRWIASETLIRIGRKSMEPILRSLVSGGESRNLQQGAHHVLNALIRKDDAVELKQLIRLIRHSGEIPESIPVKAALVLEKEGLH